MVVLDGRACRAEGGGEMAVGVLLDLAFLCCARPAAEPLYPLSSLSRTHHVPAALCHSTAVVWCIVFCARDFIATLLLTRDGTYYYLADVRPAVGRH